MFALATSLFRRSRDASTPPAAPLDLAALVGAAGWARLPQDVRRRFSTAHPDTVYVGQTDLRCSHIGQVYARLADRFFGGPLTRMNVKALPTTVRVSSNSRGGVIWERLFHRGSGHGGHVVRSTKEMAGGGLQERTDGGLSMALDVFEEAGSLVFCSRSFSLVFGRVRLPIPALLAPGVCRVTHTDLGHGYFRFTLSMVHPLWGETFHQSGVFADPCESVS